jgi:uroporphyrinogen-III synthase
VFSGFGSYDWIVFSSANGVRHFFDLFFAAFQDIRALGAMRVAAVGEATARALRDLHLQVEIVPQKPVAEALAQALIDTGSLDSAKVLVVSPHESRDVLVTMLTEARAIVDQMPVYRTEKTDLAGDPVAADFRENGADAVLFTSSSAVRSFVDQASALAPAAGAKRPLAGSIGPVTSETMKKAGLTVDFEAATSSLEALVEALVNRLSGVRG